MNTFRLRIVTPDGIRFDGLAEELVVRTTTGDTGILAGHINYVAPLGMGQATVLVDGEKRCGACIGGMVSVVNGDVTLVPTTFEWADSIDVSRAEASKARAEQILADPFQCLLLILRMACKIHTGPVTRLCISFGTPTKFHCNRTFH